MVAGNKVTGSLGESMSDSLVIGMVLTIINMTIQCVVVSGLLRLLLVLHKRQYIQPTLTRGLPILVISLVTLFLGNLLQIALWAALFLFFNEFSSFSTAFYHSTVNFATLGYGDMVMSEKYRLLGALEAANGVLMFGLTTGFLYTVLSDMMHQGWEENEASG